MDAPALKSVARAPGGVPAGLEEFLAGVEHRAYRMARYAVRDHELALDIVQDSMLRLIERYGGRPGAEWPALFFTILANRITDSRRNRWLRRMVSLFEPRLAGGDADDDPFDRGAFGLQSAEHERPDALAHAHQLRQALDAALARLPGRQRQVYLLRECQELSVKETAQALGCTEGTVKQHHFRAMQALRGLLAEVWNDEHERTE